MARLTGAGAWLVTAVVRLKVIGGHGTEGGTEGDGGGDEGVDREGGERVGGGRGQGTKVIFRSATYVEQLVFVATTRRQV